MVDHSDSLLGKPTAYPGEYSPHLLQGINRGQGRQLLGINPDALPFSGVDLWTAYEVCWCDRDGKPHVGVGEITVPCGSPYLVESKSLKLYFNSLNNHRFDSRIDFQNTVISDLSCLCGTEVGVEVFSIDDYANKGLGKVPGSCLDNLPVTDAYGSPNAELLKVMDSDLIVDETVYSHLFKSNCPVTGQPDWATVQISYRGRAIEHASLLAYIVSFRYHRAFHEQCVEQMFIDICRQCAPDYLSVRACFTRRGGLDINPVRSSSVSATPWLRTGRQ